MKILFVEPFAGISGNMLLGALMDAGVPFDYLKKEFEKLHLGAYELVNQSVNKSGIQARYFNVVLPHEHEHERCHEEHEHEHGNCHEEHVHVHEHERCHEEHVHEHERCHEEHHHAHHHHEHRNLHDIVEILEHSELDASVIARAKDVFLAIAEAEAKVHGTTVEEIHFHEVGAIDTIIDVVGNVLALRYLGIGKVFTAPVNTGFGFVECAHGLMPVPAPATAELLQGIPHYRGTVDKEMTTPTGAALLKALAIPVEEVPSGFTGERIGYGAGTRDVSIPNVLRVNVGELSCKEEKSETLCVLECNLDDMNPQILPYALEKLLDAGARDAWLQPIVMKKGRPAQLLKVLCAPEQQDAMQRILFTETTTLGVRAYTVQRTALERRWRNAQTPWGTVRIKEGLSDGVVVNAVPEFEDCKRLAKETGQALKVIEAEALRCKQVK